MYSLQVFSFNVYFREPDDYEKVKLSNCSNLSYFLLQITKRAVKVIVSID